MSDALERFLAEPTKPRNWRWVGDDGRICHPDSATTVVVHKKVGRGLLSVQLDVATQGALIEQVLAAVMR